MTAAALSEPKKKKKENGFLDMNATLECIKKIQKMVDEI